MELPRRQRAAIQERCVRYAFLDLCDPGASCPLLEGNRCLLYGQRGLSCRLWGHESRQCYERRIDAAKRSMAGFCRLMERYGLRVPPEVLAHRPPYCRVETAGHPPLSDRDASRLEERLSRLEGRFLGTQDPEERHVDFPRHLYTTFFGLRGYGALRVRIMRDYLERSSEEALQPMLERARAMSLSSADRP